LLSTTTQVGLKVGRRYALAAGIAGSHLTVVFGVWILNVLIGPWPGS